MFCLVRQNQVKVGNREFICGGAFLITARQITLHFAIADAVITRNERISNVQNDKVAD
jgi:hypothetical protein